MNFRRDVAQHKTRPKSTTFGPVITKLAGCVHPSTRNKVSFKSSTRRCYKCKKQEVVLPMRSEDSPRLMTLGSEAMMRLCEDAGEADRLCSEVRVLTGGSGPPLDT